MADRRDAGSPQWTSERFEAWLEQTARNEDRTTEEILHRMMASFWVLTEFEDLVDADATPDLTPLDQGLDLSMLEDADLGTVSDATGQDADQSTPESPDAETVRGLVEGFATYLDDHGPTTTDHTPVPGSAEAPPNTDPVDDLAERTDDLEARQDAIEADHEALEARHEALADDHDDLAERTDDLADDHEGLADAHETLADRVDADMAKVEQILKRLTQKYQETGSTLDEVEATLTSVLEDRRRDVQERDQLAGLLQAAHAHGITEGSCEDCDTRITLSLLTSPRCPHCSERLVDVRPGGWFKSDIVLTADARHQRTTDARRHQADTPRARGHAQRHQRPPEREPTETDLAAALDMMDGTDRPDTDSGDGFEWTEW